MTPTVYDGTDSGFLSEEPEGSCDADSLDTEAPGLLSGSVTAWRRAFFIPATVTKEVTTSYKLFKSLTCHLGRTNSWKITLRFSLRAM